MLSTESAATRSNKSLPFLSVVCSEVLKNSSVDEDTVAGCGRVWRLLVRILATLLLDNVEGKEMLNSFGSLAERKERFLHLFAPKNGVGKLRLSCSTTI